jgi:hypothetical protein
MPLRNAAISLELSVTLTGALFGPPLASRSGLTPRDPADDTVCVAGFSRANGFSPDNPNFPAGFGSSAFAGAAAGAAAGDPPATCVTGTG